MAHGRLCDALQLIEERSRDAPKEARFDAYSYCLLQLGQYEAFRFLLPASHETISASWRTCFALATLDRKRQAQRALAAAMKSFGRSVSLRALEVYIEGIDRKTRAELLADFDELRLEAGDKLVGLPLAMHMYGNRMEDQAVYIVETLFENAGMDQETWNLVLMIARATLSEAAFGEKLKAAAKRFPDSPVIDRHFHFPREAHEVRLGAEAEELLRSIHDINPLDKWVSQALIRSAHARGDTEEYARLIAKMTFGEDRFCSKRFVASLR